MDWQRRLMEYHHTLTDDQQIFVDIIEMDTTQRLAHFRETFTPEENAFCSILTTMQEYAKIRLHVPDSQREEINQQCLSVITPFFDRLDFLFIGFDFYMWRFESLENKLEEIMIENEREQERAELIITIMKDLRELLQPDVGYETDG
ncbi:unnamed protein product [Caenorhabditis bovis]|uniref:Uncharacterized protein n=1 Tax=Caenorhabditis bovis TaxID=2654633 RepID=A0A8S1EP19_9PELO|nr:unnamed protein product [Caenorhabditis bovis]